MTIPQVSGYGNYLYPYQAYTPLQFNNWNNYEYSTPVFKSAEYQPVIQQPLSQDTVQNSAEKEIKTKKKEGLSTGAKWAIGIAGTALATYGCVVGHRMLNKPSIEKVAKNFSEIFRRDVSKEEAKKIINDYKKLLDIKDTEKFIKEAFEQVKKDYGYEKIPIKLEVNKVKDYLGSSDATWCGEKGILSINILIDKNGKVLNTNKRVRKNLLQTIMHEFQHVKQDEIAYRTSRNEIVKAILEKKTNQQDLIHSIENILSKKSKIEIEARKLNISVEECKKQYEKILEDLKSGKYSFDKIKFDTNNKIGLDDLFKDYSKFTTGSKEYELGQKYIQNTKNYIKSGIDRNGYENQILEAEAFRTEKKFEEIYNYFANIWRIPFFQ